MTEPSNQTMVMEAQRLVLAGANETFLHVLPSLTRQELQALIARNPRVWSRFAAFLPALWG
jgi:hypothetical protein